MHDQPPATTGRATSGLGTVGATTTTRTDARPAGAPLGGGLLTGALASLCCGGTLLFTSLGLGSAWGSLGMSRFVPEALALGAVTIAAIHYLSYRRRARNRATHAGGATLRRPMLISAGAGIVFMTASFVLVEWLNHAVIHPERMTPTMAQGLIAGVPNSHLLYAALCYLVLPLLAAAPLPTARVAIQPDENRV